MIKIKHITLNDITQLVKLCMHIGEKKMVLPKNDMTKQTVSGCLCKISQDKNLAR